MPKNPLVSSFEDAFEQGVSQTKQGITKQISDTGKAVVSQVTGSTPTPSGDQAVAPSTDAIKTVQDQFNESGAQQNQQGQTQDPQIDATAIAQLDQQKQVENQKKLAQARQQLHKEYFEQTFNRKPQEQEPTVQERLEQQKQEEEQKKMSDLQKEQKKVTPVALRREQTRAETKHGAG